MMVKIEDYGPIVGRNVIEELRLIAEKLKGRVVQNINSTAVGGGVAEILSRLVPLLQELGVDTKWDFIKGGEKFFWITKKFHNALHGKPEEITQDMFDAFLDVSQKNMEEINIYGDIVFIHDPQPIALVKKKEASPNRWLWRCHIDISNPNLKVWNFLKDFIVLYDAAVFSAPAFSQQLPVRQFLIVPSIDPLSEKNIDLPQERIDSVLRKYGVPKDKPIITQISRFDYLKDPLGVIDAFKMVRRYTKCRLVLAGGTATDDPESDKVLADVREKAGKDPDIHILLVPPESDLEINALQQASAIIVQKSLKEGFGLTVAEALWKAKPVVASAVGGIPLQIAHKYSGMLCHSIDGAAFAMKQLLHSPEFAKKLGENGRNHIKQNFLITRQLKEYMLTFLALERKEDIVYL